jgi:phytoene synthase
MIALYAFMRHTDDLADDETVDLATRQERLVAWEAALQKAIHDDPPHVVPAEPESMILAAVADTVRRFAIPPEHLLAVIDGVQRDLIPHLYQTFDELAEYCHLVASAVGLACVRIWGADNHEKIVAPSQACGLAFQTINILRDIGEDLDRDRVYLPLDDLERVGYSLDELKHRVVDDRFRDLIALEVDRARTELQNARPLAAMLHPDGRPILGMMTDVYTRLLNRIETSADRLLFHRIRLGRLEKIHLALRWSLPFLRGK